jgi:hypothetical protein
VFTAGAIGFAIAEGRAHRRRSAGSGGSSSRPRFPR